MKKLLVGVLGVVSMATSASAADLPMKARPVAVSPAYNWSGFYIGGNVGYGFGRVDDESSSTLVATPIAPGPVPPPFLAPITIPFASSSRTAVDGVIGGGQIGYNAQFNRWVLGIEADIQASDQKRNTSTFTTFGGTNALPFPLTPSSTIVFGTQAETVNTRLDWFGTVRGRVGYTTGDLMWYGTGGYAYGQFKTSVTQSSVVNLQAPFIPPAGAATFASAGAFNASQNRSGWTAGGGVEGAIWATGWTWKFEYLHLDFDRVNYVFTTVTTGTVSPSVVTRSVRFTDDIVRVGLNYRFNWGGAGVVASY
jgi:outer membrane immunogenic protein